MHTAHVSRIRTTSYNHNLQSQYTTPPHTTPHPSDNPLAYPRNAPNPPLDLPSHRILLSPCSLLSLHRSYDNDPYWRSKNPYWSYFKKVWGNAPFIDGNFRLWLSGGMRKFHIQRHPQMHQHTLGLPAWMHYMDSKYDPLLDTPYLSEYSIFGPGSETGNSQKANMAENAGGSEGIHQDCSDGSWPNALGFKRPCFVSERQQKSWWYYKRYSNWNMRTNTYKDRGHYAQRPRGSIYYLTKEANQPYDPGATKEPIQGSEASDTNPEWVGLDHLWANNKLEGTEYSVKKVASGMFPPPPSEPPTVPSFNFGAGKANKADVKQWWQGIGNYPKQAALTNNAKNHAGTKGNALTSPGDR